MMQEKDGAARVMGGEATASADAGGAGMDLDGNAVALKVQVQAQIAMHKAELARLEAARWALQKLMPRRRRKQSDRQGAEWSPRPGTVYARVSGLFGEGVTLTLGEVISILAAQGVPPPKGSVASAISVLHKNGWLVKDGAGWRWPDALEP